MALHPSLPSGSGRLQRDPAPSPRCIPDTSGGFGPRLSLGSPPIPKKGSWIRNSRHKPGQEPEPGVTQGPRGWGSVQSSGKSRRDLPGMRLEPLPQPQITAAPTPKFPFPPFSRRCRCSGGMWIPKQPPGEGGSEPGVTQRGTDTPPTPASPLKTVGNAQFPWLEVPTPVLWPWLQSQTPG